MNTKPTFPQPTSLSTTVAAGLATFIAISLLTAVAFLFQRDGAPMERLAAAERACTAARLRVGTRSLHARMARRTGTPTWQANSARISEMLRAAIAADSSASCLGAATAQFNARWTGRDL